nr:uncharacterized protein LOC109765258 [Aegilops tauschii subsp. strangulata]
MAMKPSQIFSFYFAREEAPLKVTAHPGIFSPDSIESPISHDCGDQGRQIGGGRPPADLESTTQPSPRALRSIPPARSDRRRRIGGGRPTGRAQIHYINQRQRIGGGLPTCLSFPTDCSDQRRLTNKDRVCTCSKLNKGRVCTCSCLTEFWMLHISKKYVK